MAPIDANELSIINRPRRAARVAELKRSVEAHDYEISCQLVAQGIICEAGLNREALRAALNRASSQPARDN